MAYAYVRSHFDQFNVIPSIDVVANNTGIVLPDVDQPVAYYQRRVRQRAMHNNIMDPYNRLQEAFQTPQSSMGEIEQAIEDLYREKGRFAGTGGGIETTDGLIDQVRADFNERFMNTSAIRGITTGYPELDVNMDGYGGGDLAVWVGRPGRSKSWLLLKQAHAAWTAGYKPLYVSMEMGGVQNMRRLIGIHSGINPTYIKRGTLSTLARPILDRALEELLERRPMHMVTANFSRTVDQIATFAEEYQPDIIYIDAGYLLSPKKKRYGSGGRRETISDVIEELKELGTNLGIPIVITVQFNRQAEHRRRSGTVSAANFDPLAHLSLAEIGETDVIGQTASHVFGIEYPPAPLQRDAFRCFGILKGREGESGWWLTRFLPTQFSPVNLDMIPRTDPVYQTVLRAAMEAGGDGRRDGRGADPAQRTQMMRINS